MFGFLKPKLFEHDSDHFRMVKFVRNNYHNNMKLFQDCGVSLTGRTDRGYCGYMQVAYKDLVIDSDISMKVDANTVVCVYQTHNRKLLCEPGEWTVVLNTQYYELLDHYYRLKREIEALQVIEDNKVTKWHEDKQKRNCKLLHQKFG